MLWTRKWIKDNCVYKYNVLPNEDPGPEKRADVGSGRIDSVSVTGKHLDNTCLSSTCLTCLPVNNGYTLDFGCGGTRAVTPFNWSACKDQEINILGGRNRHKL